ncbi:hypothetical protein ROSA5918_11570 [Roseateles saccharophilus]|uniref:Uncharacterized protein n=2 Tax=Roseateles saccharophilus TaxID=304 RepID=A0A4R3UPG3_ROSSA|nr:hypothetical protein EV671_102344 [Roseateles saccharophilus]
MSARWLHYAAVGLVLVLVLVDAAKAECRLLRDVSPTLPALERKLDELQLYRTRTRPECLSYIQWSCEPGWTDIAVHENHRPSCGGDPKTFPAIDHFRVSQDLKVVQWFDMPNAEYLPLEKVCEHEKCSAQKAPDKKTARTAAPALSASAAR